MKKTRNRISNKRPTRIVGDNIEVECGDCFEYKTIFEFQRNYMGQYGLKAYCTKCAYIRTLKRLYNLSKEDYFKMLESQGGVCADCKQDKKLQVDHCHITKVVRALVCRSCNRKRFEIDRPRLPYL